MYGRFMQPKCEDFKKVNQRAVTKSNGMILSETSGTVSVKKCSWAEQALGLRRRLLRDGHYIMCT